MLSLSGPVPVVIDGTSLELGGIVGNNSPRSESCPCFDQLQKCARIFEYNAMPVKCSMRTLYRVRTVGAHRVTGDR